MKSFNIIKRNLFNFNKYISSAIKRIKKKLFNDGLEDRLKLLTFTREDAKYIPNTHNNQRIKERRNSLTNLVQKFTFLK